MNINAIYHAWKDLTKENKLNIVNKALEDSYKLNKPVFIHFVYDSINSKGYFVVSLQGDEFSYKIDYNDVFDLKLSYRDLFSQYANKINHINSLDTYARKLGYENFDKLFFSKCAEKITKQIDKWITTSVIYYNMSTKERGADF